MLRPPSLLDSLLSNPRPEEPARKAVREVFGGIYDVSAVTTVRSHDWEEINIGLDADPDNGVRVPLKIIYKNPWLSDHHIEIDTGDWNEWLDYVDHDINGEYSLLVIEDAPASRLQESLTLEQNGIWYAPQWVRWRPDEEPQVSRLDVLVHLPPDVSSDEKISRLAVAREVLQRYIPDPAIGRVRELEQERIAELKVILLSLTPDDMVTHDRFGLGTVISTSGSGAKAEAMVDFGEDFGVKRLVLGYAPIAKL